MAIGEVQRTGGSRVDGVPGDQTEQLRSALRTELRRLRLRGTTHQVGGTVFVVSNDAWQALSREERQAEDQRAASALDWFTQDNNSPPQTGIRWDTWDVG